MIHSRWLLGASLLLLACGRPRHAASDDAKPSAPSGDEKRVVELDLSAGAPESTDGGALFHGSVAQTFTSLVRDVERARADSKVAAVFVRFGEASFDFAESEELGHLLSSLRDVKKPVVCHAHTLNNSASLVAARGCSQIWLSPAGDVATIGIAAQMVYLHGVLDRLKVGVDFLAMGKFKSGAEPLTREGPSENARTSLTETLADMRQAWLEESNEFRKSEKLLDGLEHGPWSAGEALEHGLIDQIGFENEARDAVLKQVNLTAMEATFGPRAHKGGGLDLAGIVRILAGSSSSSSGKPHIAVVPADGAITMEPGGAFEKGGITASALGRTLRRLRSDDAVKAVVLRIDSPGGSPLASDLLWHEMMELRKKKPVVVSVGNMAASGGYYIACAGQRLFAERTSIVGSIGVFGGKIVLAPALEQFGIHSETFPASPAPGAAERAAFNSPLTPWDDATRERMRTQMQSIYDLFIARVAHGRHMEVAKVREVAEGRIWSGGQGLGNGLVDELGGLSDALAYTRKLTGLDSDAPVTVEGSRENLLDSLFLSDDAGEADAARALARLEAEPAQKLLAQVPLELRPFFSSLSPLANQEHISAALPFALVLH